MYILAVISIILCFVFPPVGFPLLGLTLLLRIGQIVAGRA